MNPLIPGRVLLAGCLCAAVLTAHAEQPLALAEALTLAVQRQPLLQSFDDAAAALRESAVAESQLPDPRLTLGVQNLPITDREALRFDRDDMTMATVGVMQEMVPRAKREAAARGLTAEAEQYRSEQAMIARRIEREAALAWLDAFEAQRKAELYRQLAEQMSAERQVAAAGVSTGASRSIEVLGLEMELATARDQHLAARRDEQKARAALARWTGAAAMRALPQELPQQLLQALPQPFEPGAETANLDAHPELKNSRQQEAVAAAAVERARADHLQNWSWEVMYGKRRSDLSDMLSFQLALDIPWDRARRQDRRTAEKLMLAEKARKLTEDRRRELSAQLQAAQAEWQTAEARELEHQARLIPAAQARLEVAQAGYAAGTMPLSSVWQARRSVLEVQVEHWSVLAERARATVKLNYFLDARSQP